MEEIIPRPADRILCPRDGRSMELMGDKSGFICSCGFSFTLEGWLRAPYLVLAEYLYDKARGRDMK